MPGAPHRDRVGHRDDLRLERRKLRQGPVRDRRGGGWRPSCNPCSHRALLSARATDGDVIFGRVADHGDAASRRSAGEVLGLTRVFLKVVGFEVGLAVG